MEKKLAKSGNTLSRNQPECAESFRGSNVQQPSVHSFSEAFRTTTVCRAEAGKAKRIRAVPYASATILALPINQFEQKLISASNRCTVSP